MSTKSVGERLSILERRVAEQDAIINTLDSRVREMDAVQRALVRRGGAEDVQKAMNELAAEIVAERRSKIDQDVEVLLASGYLQALEVGPNSVIVLQIEGVPVPEPQMVKAEQAKVLVGAKVGDLVGKYRILRAIDLGKGHADA